MSRLAQVLLAGLLVGGLALGGRAASDQTTKGTRGGPQAEAPPQSAGLPIPDSPLPMLNPVALDVLGDAGYLPAFADSGFFPFQVYLGSAPYTNGRDNRAFFFVNEEFVGTDAPEPSAGLWLAWRNADTIALTYALYQPSDLLAFPTAGYVSVRFRWDGSRVLNIDPLPAALKRR